MRIEIRQGFCKPDGELLAVVDRPHWRRLSRARKAELVHVMVQACANHGARSVEAWLAAPRGQMQHIIGYWP